MVERTISRMVGVAQLVRAPGCGPGGQGFKSLHSPHLVYGGRSSVGRAPGCGPGGRGFKSHRSPFFHAPVAQPDRAPDFESVGRRFESCRAYQSNQGFTDLFRKPFFCLASAWLTHYRALPVLYEGSPLKRRWRQYIIHKIPIKRAIPAVLARVSGYSRSSRKALSGSAGSI